MDKVSKYYKNFFNSLKETNLKVVTKESTTNNEMSENYDILVDYLPKSCEGINGYKVKKLDLKNIKFEEVSNETNSNR